MASRINISNVYGSKVLNLDSIKYNGLYYRHAEIKGKRIYCQFNNQLKYEYPFEGITEFYMEELSGDKNEDHHVILGLRISNYLQNEMKKPFGGTVNGRNYAKAPQFDSLKNDKSSYSLAVHINNQNADPYQYEDAAWSSSLGNLLSGVDSDVSTIYVEGNYSTRLNETFGEFTVTPTLLLGGCQFNDESKFPTMTVRMGIENKSGTYTSSSSGGYGLSGRARGTIRIYDNNGSLLHDIYLDNDGVSLGSTAPMTYGIDLSINGSNICYYQKNNYTIELDVEYWNGNTGVSLEY